MFSSIGLTVSGLIFILLIAIFYFSKKRRHTLENDIFTFFDYAIKVKAEYLESGIKRRIDQICFFDRKDGINTTKTIIKDGKPLRVMIPERILKKFYDNNETEFISAYVNYLKGIKKNVGIRN